MKRKKTRGCYCWCCDSVRANEKFSGKGHTRHLCKDCARLGKEELAYRQGVRDIDRLLRWGPFIPRKRRKEFATYLSHPNPRIQKYAQEVAACAAEERHLLQDALCAELPGIEDEIAAFADVDTEESGGQPLSESEFWALCASIPWPADADGWRADEEESEPTAPVTY